DGPGHSGAVQDRVRGTLPVSTLVRLDHFAGECGDRGVHEFEEAEGRLPAHLRGGAAVLVADVAASDRRVLAGFPGGGVGLAAATVRGLLRGGGFAHRGYLSRTSAQRSASMVARRCATSSGWLERS